MTCPTSCPWMPHPDNADWERCGRVTCGVERRNPVVAAREAAQGGARVKVAPGSTGVTNGAQNGDMTGSASASEGDA